MLGTNREEVIAGEIMRQTKLAVFAVFSEIPLDIEGSNLQEKGLCPSTVHEFYDTDEEYKLAMDGYIEKNSKVLFKNVSLQWDTCDCSDFVCSHDDFVCGIEINDGDKTWNIIYEDQEYIYIEGLNTVQIPISGASVYDFIRACELCGIKLEFSDYALSLLSEKMTSL